MCRGLKVMDFYKKLVAIVLSCTVVGMAGGNVSFFAEEAVEMPADAVSQKNESNFSKYIKHGVEIGAGILGAVGCAAFVTKLYLMNREKDEQIEQLREIISSKCSDLKSVGISENDGVEFLKKRSEEIQNVLQKKIEQNNELSQKIEECERNNKNVSDELQKVYDCWACSTLYSEPHKFEGKEKEGKKEGKKKKSELFSSRYLSIKRLIYIFVYAPKHKDEDILESFSKNITASYRDINGTIISYGANIERWKMWTNENVNGYLNLLLNEPVKHNKYKGDKGKNLVYVDNERENEFKSMITFLDGINTLTSGKKFEIAKEISKCVLGQIIFQKLDSENVISSDLMKNVTIKINRDCAVIENYMDFLKKEKERAVKK